MKSKLVRDKIPETIRKDNQKPIIHTANDSEYWQSLKDKLKEEVNEFDKESSKEEFADILEVLEAIGKLKHFNPKEIKQIKEDKAKLRGKFEKRIILEKIKD